MSRLHITNGDSAAGTLRTFLPDPVTITADVLHEGPAPMTRTPGEWHAVRARFLARPDQRDADAIRRNLADWDERIARASGTDDIVLWFEHDLFDQLLLIRTLDVLGARAKGAGPTRDGLPRVTLICIGEFPGVERFVGLGQLTAEQLATLVDRREPVTRDHYELARDAWRAFRAPDPRELLAVVARLGTDARARRALPFLRDSLVRFLAEYPSTTNGLGRTEQLIVEALRERPSSGIGLFASTERREPRPFMGDRSFFDRIRAVADARVPLVSIDPRDDAVDLRRHTIALTAAGRDVLEGRADAVALNGIDTWRGGVHLQGTQTPWRWDAAAETLVS